MINVPLGHFAGMRIIWNPLALEATKERKFPVSKNRSKRVHKKLVKRFGGEFVMRPCMWRFDGNLIAHPSLKPQLEAAPRNQP